MQTAYDLVWLSCERTPDHPALVDDRTDRQLTYRELMLEIDQVAAGLASRGIGRGSRVATALPNLFEHCVVLLALQRLGAVPALMNFRLKPEDIVQLTEQGEMAGAVILSDGDLAEVIGSALPKEAPLIAVGGSPDSAEPFEACRGDPSVLPSVPTPDPEEAAFIFYTSGTTGLPKGVVIAHRTTEHRIVWLSPQAGLRHGGHNRSLGIVPLSHAIGFYGQFLVTLAYGGTYYTLSAFEPRKAVDLIERHRINYLFAVPTHYNALVNAPNYDVGRMTSLELVLYGGAPINEGLLDRLNREWPATIRHIYGTTETMCSLYNPEPMGRPRTLRPGYYSRVRVVRMGGAPDDIVGAGDEGELIVDATADTIFTAYLNRPDATAEKLRDGWYYTGDVCVVQEDGDLELVGRVDDVIRTGGESVHPEEVEFVLTTHPGVRDAAVIGLEDPYWGEIVCACVVPADEALEWAVLDAHCVDSRLARFKRPRAYVFLDGLPRNAANKVLRRELRDVAARAKEAKAEVAFHAVA